MIAKPVHLDERAIRDLLGHADARVAAVAAEAMRLRAAIRHHQAQTGHHLCWKNDLELWRHLDPTAAYPHDTLPVRDEFLTQCGRYYQSRLEDTSYTEPEPMLKVVAESGDSIEHA